MAVRLNSYEVLQCLHATGVFKEKQSCLICSDLFSKNIQIFLRYIDGNIFEINATNASFCSKAATRTIKGFKLTI